jgi:alanine-synthesizing transaminase
MRERPVRLRPLSKAEMRQSSIPFSRRTSWDTTETPLARALREHVAAGLPLMDLTASNPTQCGFTYDAERLLAPLSDAGALNYQPIPRGMLSAREAVCRYYADGNIQLDPSQIFLTTSTSEGYSFLFRLLCDSGDEVLIAQPSYPLFDFLATLDDVRLVPYSLVYDHGWQIDVAGLRQQITARTRAIVVVNPNNPTGHFTKPWERAELEDLCRQYDLALIVDEVFLDYPLSPEAKGAEFSFASGEASVPTFVLSGLSKVAALPQMKAAWIACLGPEQQRREAEARLEIVADTFLSMNAPIQYALPSWLASRHGIQAEIRDRVRQNLAALDELLVRQSLVSRLEVEAGWYSVLRIPAVKVDDETALELLNRDVSVHPGYYFGFPGSGWLVVSLLCRKQTFYSGISAVLDLVQEWEPIKILPEPDS